MIKQQCISDPTNLYCHTQYFGNPKGTHGRCTPVIGIVLHCLNRSQRDYDQFQKSKNKVQAGSDTDHLGLHYTVGDMGAIRYAHLDDIVWTNEQYGNWPVDLMPPYTYAGFPQLDPAYPMDYQVINIGIMSSFVETHDSKCNCAETPLGLCEKDYKKLIHLVRHISEVLGIAVSPDFIKFHTEIEDLGPECVEECLCKDNEKFFNDLCAFTNKPANGDPSFELSPEIETLYGEDCNGVKVKAPTECLVPYIAEHVQKLIKPILVQATFTDQLFSLTPNEYKQYPLNEILYNSCPEFKQPNPTLNSFDWGTLKAPCKGFYSVEVNIPNPPNGVEGFVHVNNQVMAIFDLINGSYTYHTVLEMNDCLSVHFTNNTDEIVTFDLKGYVILNKIGAINE